MRRAAALPRRDESSCASARQTDATVDGALGGDGRRAAGGDGTDGHGPGPLPQTDHPDKHQQHRPSSAAPPVTSSTARHQHHRPSPAPPPACQTHETTGGPVGDNKAGETARGGAAASPQAATVVAAIADAAVAATGSPSTSAAVAADDGLCADPLPRGAALAAAAEAARQCTTAARSRQTSTDAAAATAAAIPTFTQLDNDSEKVHYILNIGLCINFQVAPAATRLAQPAPPARSAFGDSSAARAAVQHPFEVVRVVRLRRGGARRHHPPPPPPAAATTNFHPRGAVGGVRRAVAAAVVLARALSHRSPTPPALPDPPHLVALLVPLFILAPAFSSGSPPQWDNVDTAAGRRREGGCPPPPRLAAGLRSPPSPLSHP